MKPSMSDLSSMRRLQKPSVDFKRRQVLQKYIIRVVTDVRISFHLVGTIGGLLEYPKSSNLFQVGLR